MTPPPVSAPPPATIPMTITARTTTPEAPPARTPGSSGAVGTPHTRLEGHAKVTGAARYAGDVPFAELAYGWLVTSTVARGRIRSTSAPRPSSRCPACSASCTTGTRRASRPGSA